jgi:hypothetical protein
MVPVLSLWLPILVSAVLVFVLSSLIHMVLSYHKSDMAALPAEEEIMTALRRHDLAPGAYVMPHARSMEEMKDPAYIERRTQGPVGFLTILPSGKPDMTRELGAWFVYSLVVGVLAAYIAGRALGPAADYGSVFRFAGATAFIAYGLGTWQDSIWYGQKWSTAAKNTLDGLIYGLATGGVFGWLWPGA